METKEKKNGVAVISTQGNKGNAFVNNNPVNKVSTPIKDGKEEGKDEEKKDDPKQGAEQQPKAEEPKAAEIKPEAAKAEPFKPVMNLEGTLKFIEEMHERKVKRDKYLATLKNLDEFEIDLKKDNDDIDNYYTGCILTIQDDAGRKFTTKNPVIVWTIAQHITSICEGKLTEVEAGLVLPV
jgi:hypothetical protein